jgi:hypothetical protein
MSVSLYGSGNTAIQVVQATTTSQTSTTSSSYVTTAITGSITPQSTTSKILVLVSSNFYNGTVNANNTFSLYRGSSPAPSADIMHTYCGSAVEGTINFNYLDSPATTSSTTYTVYFKTSTGTLYVPNNGILATITLVEISGS